MSTFRVQHVFQHVNGLSKDQYVNTWYFNRIVVGTVDYTPLASAVKGFYHTAIPSGGLTVAGYLGGLSDGPNARVKIYNLDDPSSPGVPRQPVYEEQYNPTSHGASTGNMPEECAVCLSYEAAPASGVPIARRRGRVYIGPLTNNANSSTGSNDQPTVSVTFQQVLTQSAKQMAEVALTDSWQWCLHSPTSALDPPIVRCWVDNAFDTQRRRGIKPSSRTIEDIP